MAAMALAAFPACDDFLNRPTEDQPVVDGFYLNDEQLYMAVNPIYGSPWYDFQRGFFKIGEVMSGNAYWGSSPYLTYTVNSTDEDLVNMSASLWTVNGYCNATMKNIKEKAGGACTQAAIDATVGECLTLKALAYFFLVRNFGGVPIIHDNSAIIAEGSYNSVPRATPKSVYKYIVKTLDKAMELLPKQAAAGRVDYYCAEGLLAKVYLTMAGIDGSLNNEYLQKAVDLADDVKKNSGRELVANYGDIFRASFNTSPESLLAWRWTVDGEDWTRQNTLQSDLIMDGFDETGATWGGWAGPSADLLQAFDVDPAEDPKNRSNVDTRRKATCMMAGDTYPYFWRDYASTFAAGAFEVCDFYYNEDEATIKSRGDLKGSGQFQGPCCAQFVKHIVGRNCDHVAELGVGLQRMAYGNHTHILRLADVYLVLAEAQALLDGGTTTNADALDAFNKVRQRAVSSATLATSITWEQIWKERRLELACEGDRWYDFVRLSYYNVDEAIAQLKAMKRGTYGGRSGDKDAFKAWFNSGYTVWDGTEVKFTAEQTPNISKSTFSLPFPDTDLLMNPLLTQDPIEVDVEQYNY